MLKCERGMRSAAHHEALEERAVQFVGAHAHLECMHLHLWPQLFVVANVDDVLDTDAHRRQGVCLEHLACLLHN
eukprot:scaffold14790_cov29-Tisochrysis_lutea.AAC.3